MPATGFFEVAAAATSALADSSASVLTGLIIVSPMVLTLVDKTADNVNLSCSISMDGALKIMSAGTGISEGQYGHN